MYCVGIEFVDEVYWVECVVFCFGYFFVFGVVYEFGEMYFFEGYFVGEFL